MRGETLEKLKKLGRFLLLLLGFMVLFTLLTLLLALLRGETWHFSFPTVLLGGVFGAAATTLRFRANRWPR